MVVLLDGQVVLLIFGVDVKFAIVHNCLFPPSVRYIQYDSESLLAVRKTHHCMKIIESYPETSPGCSKSTFIFCQVSFKELFTLFVFASTLNHCPSAAIGRHVTRYIFWFSENINFIYTGDVESLPF
uniref:Putative ficolin/ixoderin n=1 Tax=Ixodes ricinus TaxID=34613 RepID=A0A6B0UPN2_IXORI